MTDIVSRKKRSQMMTGIRSTDTKPELILRRGLHRRGFRYRLHDRSLPGSPDIVFPRHRAVILVNGCFWHGHECHLFRWPQSRESYWRDKITGNMERDRCNRRKLLEQGWRICRVWECALRGKQCLPVDSVHPKIADFRELATGAGQISCHIGRKMDWSGEILPVLRADFGGIGVHLCLIRRNRTYL